MKSNQNITIIPRDEIPAIEEVSTPNGTINIGRLADFRKHALLNELMPQQKHNISFAWTSLNPNQILPVHKHPIDSMIIICEGKGLYIGEFQEELFAGDVVYVKKNALHGFQAGEQELKCLSIQFEETGLYSNENHELVRFGENSKYDCLVKLNNHWVGKFERLCKELNADIQQHGDNYLKSLFGLIGRWSHVFQNILMLRQVHSSNKEIRELFKSHLIEEFGHDNLIEHYNYRWDARLEAYFSWFTNQMYVLCDPRKLILTHMVLESAGDIFSNEFKKSLSAEPDLKEYIELHAHLDEDHATLGSEHIVRFCHEHYELAKEVCESSWLMFMEMFERFRDISREYLLPEDAKKLELA